MIQKAEQKMLNDIKAKGLQDVELATLLHCTAVTVYCWRTGRANPRSVGHRRQIKEIHEMIKRFEAEGVDSPQGLFDRLSAKQ